MTGVVQPRIVCKRCGERTVFRTCAPCKLALAGIAHPRPVLRKRRWISVFRSNLRPVDKMHIAAKKLVMGAYWNCHPASSGQARRISVEFDKLLREAGHAVGNLNEPPPGWTVEDDIREELLALGEITSLRKVS